MDIQWEAVECHWTDECDSRGHCIHYLKISVQPQSFQLGQHIQRLKLFQIENLSVGQPELFYEGDIDWDPFSFSPHLWSQYLINPLLINDKSGVSPANQEKSIQSDAELFIVNLWNILETRILKEEVKLSDKFERKMNYLSLKARTNTTV